MNEKLPLLLLFIALGVPLAIIGWIYRKIIQLCIILMMPINGLYKTKFLVRNYN